MTKETFWNEIEQRWNGEFQLFAQWLDEYKKQNNWDDLFNGGIEYFRRAYDGNGYDPTGGKSEAPKFHDLPDAMQLGIFVQYTTEQSHSSGSFVIEEGDTMDEIIANIKEWFCEEHSAAVNDHIQGKYMDEQSDSGSPEPDEQAGDYYNEPQC